VCFLPRMQLLYAKAASRGGLSQCEEIVWN
jgi:hypothetical protein